MGLKMPLRVHTRMQYTDDGDAVVGETEINHMPPYGTTAITFANGFADNPLERIVGKLIEGGGDIIDVAMRLIDSPLLQCV